jgi:hypothetical protein
MDLSGYEPARDFEVLPPGKYTVEIEKAEIKQTKAGDGHYMELCLSILDEGPCQNRKLWDRLNIHNPSQKAQEIALRKLRSLGDAIGVQVVTSEDQFLGRQCVASVKVNKEGQNDIRSYSPCGQPDSTVTQEKPNIPPVVPAQATGRPKPPWVK